MSRFCCAAFVLAALLAALSPVAVRTAVADDGLPSARTVALDPLPLSDQVPGFPVTMSVRLTDARGGAVPGMQIRFYVYTPVFEGRLMDVGEVVTNDAGIASLVYRPTWLGAHKAIARFGGNGDYDAVSVSLQFNATGPIVLYHDHPFGLDPIRTWLPLGGIALTLLAWAALGYVMLTTVVAVRAGAGAQHGLQAARVPAEEWGAPRPAPVRRLAIVLVVLLALAIPVALFLPRSPGDEALLEPPLDVSPVTDAAALATGIPVRLVLSIPTLRLNESGQVTPDAAALAPALAVGTDEIFVLDTIKGRIMNVGEDGMLSVWMAGGPPDGTEQPMPGGMVGGETLRGASAMTIHRGKLYVANTFAGNIVVAAPPGAVLDVIQPNAPAAEEPLLPAGIAVSARGDIWLSDPANHRVVVVSAVGEFQGLVGRGKRSSEATGLDNPGAIALDAQGNVYIADRGNARVVKYSPLGVLLLEIGTGILVSPAGIAVDEAGRVFVADFALSSVLVFDAQGRLSGSITRQEPGDPESARWFQAPQAVTVQGTTLYVLDRLAGLQVFEIPRGALR